MNKISSYFKELDNEHAKRYLQKIFVIQNTDPCCLERVDMSKGINSSYQIVNLST